MKINSEDLVVKFYSSFQKRDAEMMVACYHPEAVFKDPVFGELSAEDTKAMWRMLVQRGKDLSIQFTIQHTTEDSASASWLATYTFSLTGRKISNSIQANFIVKDNLIYKHTDTFSLTKWLFMAFGLKGLLIAYIPPLKNKFKAGIKKALIQFKKSNPS